MLFQGHTFKGRVSDKGTLGVDSVPRSNTENVPTSPHLLSHWGPGIVQPDPFRVGSSEPR